MAKGLRERTCAWSQGELKRAGFENGLCLSLVVWSWGSNLVLLSLSSFINEERRFDLVISVSCPVLQFLMTLFQHPRLGHTLHHCSYVFVRIKSGIVFPNTLTLQLQFACCHFIWFVLPLLFILYKVLFSRTILVFKWLCFPENVLFTYCHHQNYRIIEY